MTIISIVSREPLPVGGYRLGQIVFLLKRKPSAWHRFWTRVILGWIWENEK